MTASQPTTLKMRRSGILLHPTSFPGRFGIGDLGGEAYRFIDFLAETGQQLWQILPLGPTGSGNSPYMCYSAMAGNPLLISPDRLQQDGLLNEHDFEGLPEFALDRVRFDTVIQTKLTLLRKASDNFKHQATPEQKDKFHQFCESKAYWLDDFALFMALKNEHNGTAWHTWEHEIASRYPEALEAAKERLSDGIFFEKFLQFEFFRQWSDVRNYANEKGVQIIGDIPIYVAQDSADVWAHPKNFHLDEATNEPSLMAGAPPDYFSETGQLWGNPIYNWEYMQQSNFKWWIQRFHAMLDYVDMIRVDHFIGFESFWAIPKGSSDARSGQWTKAPGDALFTTLQQELGVLPILAEDLGSVTPEVEALRDKFEFPGMKILQFAFGDTPKNPYLPFNYDRNFLVYTGTHDNDTTVGWYTTLSDKERQDVLTYLGCVSHDGIHWDMIRLAFSSIANFAIVPLQDVLGLGTEARMNFPGKQEGNWEWRYREHDLNQDVRDRLKHITHFFDRAPSHKHH